jgi:D-alanyl-D-alanine carboxypeptidase
MAACGPEEVGRVDLDAPPDGGASGSVDRRTLLLGAAGALVAAGLPWPARADGYSAVADRPGARFDPLLARRLQRVLRDAVRDPSTHFPGVILHVQGNRLGAWTGVAGRGQVAPATPMRPGDRFRAGSIAKTFVAVALLQLAERGRLALDARLPEVLPASIIGRFANAPDITVRMLLNHRSGIADWLTPDVNEQIARNPGKVWTVSEFLDLAAAQPTLFAPGTSYGYSNTNYNLLGLIIEQLAGHSWRHQVTRRVIRPLELAHTYLPTPGQGSMRGRHAHGYGQLDGQSVDITHVDPSMAGAAGGGALVTTVEDLANFLDALLKGRLFARRATLRQMLAFSPAPDEGGQVGYGLGVEHRVLPGDHHLIGNLGMTAGYAAYVGRLRNTGVTLAVALNWEEPPLLLIPAVKAIAARHV